MSYPAIQKVSDAQNAVDVPTDTSTFNGQLSASDIDVQTALETLDDHTHDDRYYTETEVDALLASGALSIKTTSTTESINISSFNVVRQTASGITTTFTNLATGESIIVKNRSGGNNTINHTIDGVATPTLADGDSVYLLWNGTDFDAL